MSYAISQNVNFYIVSSVFGLSNEKHEDNHQQCNDFPYQLDVSTCRKKHASNTKIFVIEMERFMMCYIVRSKD